MFIKIGLNLDHLSIYKLTVENNVSLNAECSMKSVPSVIICLNLSTQTRATSDSLLITYSKCKPYLKKITI